VKTCTKCSETKPLDQFYRDKKTRDGCTIQCKACRKAYDQANRETIAQRQRAYNVANAEANAEYQRNYRRANAQAIASRRRDYIAANAQAISSRQRNYRAANLHIEWESYYRRRARRYGFEPVVETFTRSDVIT
jgi:hypothetical protein